MSGSLAQFFVATPQGQAQLVLQPMKVSKFTPYVEQFLLKAAPDRRARLQAIPSQLQEASNLTELEPETLSSPYESQRLDFAFTVLTEPSLRSRRPRQQRVALIEADGVNADPELFCDDANLHDLGSYREATPWSIVQSQVISLLPGIAKVSPRVELRLIKQPFHAEVRVA